MYCTTTNLINNLARGNVKFTTGKLDVMKNHLLNCDYVPPQVQDCASKHRKSDSNETSDDDAGSTVTSKRSHSLIESGDPSQGRTDGMFSDNSWPLVDLREALKQPASTLIHCHITLMFQLCLGWEYRSH